MPKLKRIAPGATLGFVGVSGVVPEPLQLEKAADVARQMGFRVKMGDSCAARYGYLSGQDAMRARDLNQMVNDPAVDAIVCARGGYGTPRILDKLDYEAMARARKALLGYSDITGIHLAMARHCPMPTLHGPMPTTEWACPGFEGFTQDSLMDLLYDKQVGKPLQNPPGVLPPRAIRPGAAEGVLVGGNLSLVCALAGTPYMPDLTGKLLLLEDVDEYLYRIDRMFTQLRLAGAFAGCAGLVLGGFTRCEPQHMDRSLALDQIVADCVADQVHGPILSGLMIGHCDTKIALALGIRYRLDAGAGALTPLESPYED